jgi:hypothetical protein
VIHMVMVFPGTPQEYAMDGYLKGILDESKKAVSKDFDIIFLVDGGERYGKSTLAQQCAYFMDPTFDLSRVCFTPDEFKKAVLNAKPYTAVVYDEAYTGLTSRGTMSIINRALVSMLAEIGQRNLIIFVVMPTFFDLDKYVALWRSRALLHVFLGKDFERGYFAAYNETTKKYLYIEGKKFYEYKGRVKPNFFGRFPNKYTVDEAGYRQKKRDSLSGRAKQQEEAAQRREVDLAILERVMALGDKVPHKIKIEMLGVSPATYFRKLSEWKEQNKDSGATEEEKNSLLPEEIGQNDLRIDESLGN